MTAFFLCRKETKRGYDLKYIYHLLIDKDDMGGKLSLYNQDSSSKRNDWIPGNEGENGNVIRLDWVLITIVFSGFKTIPIRWYYFVTTGWFFTDLAVGLIVDMGKPWNKELVECWRKNGILDPKFGYHYNLKRCCEELKGGAYMESKELCKSLTWGYGK